METFSGSMKHSGGPLETAPPELGGKHRDSGDDGDSDDSTSTTFCATPRIRNPQPRLAACFRGTVRYAPISCHLQRELCRKDDVETWIYMLVELTTGNLPWKNVQDMNQVGQYKQRCRQPPDVDELFAGCPPEYQQAMIITDANNFYDAPNYQEIYNLMRQAIQNQQVQEFPYDWEKGPDCF